MLGSGKSIVTLSVIVALLVGSIGCVPSTPPETSTPTPPPVIRQEIPSRGSATKYLSPTKIYHLVGNPLNLQGVTNVQDTSYVVTGLLNKSVEEKINNRLQALYQSIKEAPLPPYRGVRVAIPDGSELVQNTLQTEVPFNYNNLLSLTITNHRSYRAPTHHQPQNVVTIETVTFDLYTGDVLSFGDLFATDVDHLTLVNNYIASKVIKYEPGDEHPWWIEEEPFRLAAPFKGIDEDPKFYLIPEGIILIFDHKTPAVQTHLYPVRLRIDYNQLGDVFAFAARYATTGELYEAPVVKKELVQSKQAPSGLHGFVVDKVHVETSLSAPQGLPPKIDALLSELSQGYVPLVQELSGKVQGNDYCMVGQYIHARQLGPYLSIERYMSSYMQSSQEQKQVLYMCLDESYRPLSLSDLFVPDYQYAEGVKQYLQNILTAEKYQGPLTKDEVYADLQFNLGPREINFCTNKVLDQHKGPLRFSIPYVYFGCDNMTIFK